MARRALSWQEWPCCGSTASQLHGAALGPSGEWARLPSQGRALPLPRTRMSRQKPFCTAKESCLNGPTIGSGLQGHCCDVCCISVVSTTQKIDKSPNVVKAKFLKALNYAGFRSPVSLGVRGVGSSNLPSPDPSPQLVKIFQEVRNPPMRLKDVSKSGLAEKFEAAA